jgi:hypothetical protein
MARKKVTNPVEYRGFHEKGKPAKNKAREGDIEFTQPRWWKLDDGAVAGAIRSTIDHMRHVQTSIEMQRQVCARLYGGTTPGTFYGISSDRMHLVHPSLTGRLTYNVIAIVVDAIVSKLCKQAVRPMFLTQGGDYRLQRRAKKLNQFAEGIFYETKFDQLDPIAVRDGCVLGDGPLHVYEDPVTHRVKIERVMPSELYVDEIDGFYGDPRQMHRVKNVDKDQLKAAFGYDENGKEKPDVMAMIDTCGTMTTDDLGGTYQYVSDAIGVAESWHLPSGPDADDGEHAIIIDTGVLFREKWKKTRFPFTRFSWKPRIYGWHGASLAEELIGDQVEMNHLLNLFQKAFRMMAAFRVWIEAGTVPAQHFQDKVGTILEGRPGSQPPVFLTPPALNPQYFQHFHDIEDRAFKKARLSQMTAVGEKPAGLDSGEAQRVYHDIEGEGFQEIGHRREAFHLDAISLVIDVVRDIFEREGKYELKAPVQSAAMPGIRFLRTLDWKNIHMEDDEYVLRCYPVSALPQTPQGKLATVQDLARAGYIDQDTARKLIDFPDLQSVTTLLGAAEDWIMSTLDGIVEDGKYTPPDPWMNLAMAENLAMQEFSLGAANGMEDEKLDMLRTFISQVRDYKAQGVAAMQAQQMAQQPQGAQAGQGVGAPPPVSPLLPPPQQQAA